ncbi:MAG: TolC family protein [Pirellulaceae bacterium]
MSRQTSSTFALFLAVLTALTGCVPTQPFYLREDGDMSHYLDQATDYETPDVLTASLEEVTQTESPYTLSDPEFREAWDLSLEECVSIALNNSKVIRGASQPSLTGAEQINAGQDSIVASIQGASFQSTAGVATTYGPAQSETNPGFYNTATSLRNSIGILPSINSLTNQGVEAALSEFDAQLTSSVNWSKTDRPVNVTPAFGGFPSVTLSDTSDFDVTLSKKTATGAHFFARHTVGYNRGNQFGSLRAVPSNWTTALELETQIPLLQGAGTQVNRLPVIIGRIQTDKNIAGLYANIQYALCNIEIRYWDLYFAYRRLETAKTGRDSALQIWKLVKARLDGGEADTQQEAQAREQYFFFRSQVESALNSVYSAENSLRWLLGLASTDGRLIRPSDEPTLARVDFDGRGVISEAVGRRPVVLQVKWEVKQREMEMILARNRLLPRLNAFGLYRFVGVGDELIRANRNGLDFPALGSTAWEGLTDGNFQEYLFGGTFEMPVGFRRELAGVRNAELNLARERAVLEDLELDVAREASESLRAVNANYHLAQSHFNRWVASNKEVEVLNLRAEEGVERLDLVLEAQRRRAQSQIDYYGAVVEYNQAISLLHMRKGSIAEYCGVFMAEGPWPAKAYWDATGHARRRDAATFMDYGWTRPRVISRGPVGEGYAPGNEFYYEGEMGEEIPTPTPTPADGGMPMDGPMPMDNGGLPTSASVPQGDSGPALNPPAGSVLRASRQEAIGSGLGGYRGASHMPRQNGFGPSPAMGGMGSHGIQQVSFEQPISEPSASAVAPPQAANSATSVSWTTPSRAAPARLPNSAAGGAKPIGSSAAWQAKR